MKHTKDQYPLMGTAPGTSGRAQGEPLSAAGNNLTRRRFLGGAMAAAASASVLGAWPGLAAGEPVPAAQPVPPPRKSKAMSYALRTTSSRGPGSSRPAPSALAP